MTLKLITFKSIILFFIQLTFCADHIDTLLNKFNLYKEASAQDQKMIKIYINNLLYHINPENLIPQYSYTFIDTESKNSYTISWNNQLIYNEKKVIQRTIKLTLKKNNENPENSITLFNFFKNS